MKKKDKKEALALKEAKRQHVIELLKEGRYAEVEIFNFNERLHEKTVYLFDDTRKGINKIFKGKRSPFRKIKKMFQKKCK